MSKNQVKNKKKQVYRFSGKFSYLLLFTWLFLLGSFHASAQETIKKTKNWIGAFWWWC